LPGLQLVSSTQPFAQLLPEQVKGLQSTGAWVGQLGVEPLQLTGGMAVLPVQLGAWHCTALLWNESTGQSAEFPGHTSATSHTPELPRHVVLGPKNESAGQVPLEPVQNSATSQKPTLARHIVLLFSNTSGGQLAELPLQDSAGSQKPVEPRQTPLVLKLSPGQVVCEPSQTSC
jgi:hypothetical protein